MMINAAGEPHPLQIDLESLEFIGVPGNGLVTINNLQHLADAEIILAELVEGDISAK